jgi:hypothetical protein
MEIVIKIFFRVVSVVRSFDYDVADVGFVKKMFSTRVGGLWQIL